MSSRVITTAISLLATLYLTNSSIADEAPQTFKSLVARGFKVVATVFIPSEAQTSKIPALVVTLQQDKAVAVCTLSVGQWETMPKVVLEETPGLCDVRFY